MTTKPETDMIFTKQTRVALLALCMAPCAVLSAASRPNILIAISDDQSWLHMSAYGSKMVETPHFDRIAREGILFRKAFAASPGCSPSRAAFLTGRNTWQIEHAGTHASFFDPKYKTFPDRLQEEGYFVGHTGKGWGPGNFQKLGRKFNPAGPRFVGRGKSKSYAGAFQEFLRRRPQDQPFCFWFGSKDPHRSYEKGSGLAKGKRLADAEVPPFLPDTPEIRSDMLDYAFEVERFDSDFGKILDLLEESGELDETLIIVTSDNGTPIPRAKANCYEYGIHMPLAIRWGKHISSGRIVDDLVGFTDLTATIYEVTNVRHPSEFPLTGKSIVNILESEKSGIVDEQRTAVFSSRERHSSSRFNSLGYPQRCIRTHDFLFIRNFKPERWPAGPAQKFAHAKYDPDGNLVESKLGPEFGGFHDIDACPTLTFLIDNQNNAEIKRFLQLAVGKRPAVELFDIKKDPGCLVNLAANPEYAAVRQRLNNRLNEYLTETNDPRVVGNGDVWESYPRVSSLRWFPIPDWAQNDSSSLPDQGWLERRRPQ